MDACVAPPKVEQLTDCEKPALNSHIFKIWETNDPIACWPTKDKKGWFTKICFYKDKNLWFPVTNSGHKGAGLIVFLSMKIEAKDDFLEITGHGKNCVFADVMYY